MFVLYEMKDLVRIPPNMFHLKLNAALESELNRKLANKVVLNVGLCIALHDITKIEESFILPSDGASHTRVHFRYIVFRPFMEEVIVGKIRNVSRDGVQITLEFFDDIYIPTTMLPHPSRFDETEQAWIWEYDVGDGVKHDLFMDPGEQIRFKVISEHFTEINPTGPEINEQGGSLSQSTVSVGSATTTSAEQLLSDNKVAYSLTGSINESGLGLLSWWENAG